MNNNEIKVNVEIIKVVENSYHYHSSIELIYIINGCLEVDKVDHKYVLEKGDMYIINSEDIHKIKTINEDNIILIANINETLVKELHGGLYGDMFRGRYIKNLVDIDYLCNNTYIEDKHDAVQKLKEYLLRVYIIKSLYNECINGDETATIMKKYIHNCDFYYKMIISLMIEEFGIVECFQKIADLDDDMSEKNYTFIRYISENYSNKITLDDISKEFNFSKYYISRLLNEKDFGGLNNYLKNIRSYKGKDMLFNTNKSISEISELVGFGTTSMFTNSFKEIFGMTPTEYRKKFDVPSRTAIKIKLSEEKIEEILKENLADFVEFSKNIKYGDRLKLDFKLLDKIESNYITPEHRFTLKSENPIYDSCNLNRKDELYSIDFRNCIISSDVHVENTSMEQRYEKLLKCIREKANIEEVISMDDLVSKEQIETKVYYYYCFINMLKKNVVKYSKDYLITRDDNGSYAILILIRQDNNKNFNNEIDVKLELAKGTYKIAVHKLDYNNLENLHPKTEREKDIIKRMTMPKCYLNIIENNEFKLSCKVGEQYLIEINN